ncbi:MAG TPA: DUF3617 domain-containing protein [Candidatus Saccharimonadales bacterium]|nr:DUF3617 domain-containing protein [Candidatus Saccharimonadales bacterium]
MKPNRISLFTLVFFALLASAATDNLSIKPGLWEVTTSSESKGAPPVDPARKAEMEKMMAKMSPEMRARVEAAQKKSQAHMAGPNVRKSCVTKEDLSGALGMPKEADKCTRTVIKATSSTQEIRVDCAQGEHKSSALLRVTATNSENWSGTMDTTIAAAGKDITVRTNMSGKWLGADCGDVKPLSHK